MPRAAIRPLVLRVGVGLVAGLPRLIGVGIAVIVLVLAVLIAILRRPEAERVIILLVLLLIGRLLLTVGLLIGILLLLLAIGLIRLRVFEQVVGLVDLVHFLCARSVAGMEVGVVLLGKAAIGLLDLVLARAMRYAEHLIRITCHLSSPPNLIT